MALHRFFVEKQALSDETASTFPLLLSADDRRHAAVLRLRPGEHIAVIDGAGDYFECEVVDSGDPLTVRIAGRAHREPDPFSLTLCVGLPKGSTFDGIVRGGTELGVDRFISFGARRCVATPSGDRLAKRLDRWTAIARNAAMQAGRDRIPSIDAVAQTSDLIARLQDCDGVLLCWEDADATETLPRAFESFRSQGDGRLERLGVVIGPEGGLAEEENAELRAGLPRSAPLTLGPSILRVETAALCAVAQTLYELRR